MNTKRALLCLLLAAQCFATVTAVSVTPSSGTGYTQQFQIAFTSTAGQTDVSLMIASFSPTVPGLQRGPCQVQGIATTGQIQLFLDSGSTVNGQQLTSGTLNNGHCTINLSTTSMSFAGTNEAFNVNATFSSSAPGPISVFGRSLDSHGVTSNWITLGSWTVGPPPPPPVFGLSVTPTNLSGNPQTFIANATAASGDPSDLNYVVLRFGGQVNGCNVRLDLTTRYFAVLDDAGVTWFDGSTGANDFNAHNHQCNVDPSTENYGEFQRDGLSASIEIIFLGSFMSTTQPMSGMVQGWRDSAPFINLGNWNIPVLTTTPISSVITTWQDMTQDEIGNDNFTGADVLLPSLSKPAPYVSVWTASGTRIVKMGDGFTVSISNAKPNSQVWVRENSTTIPGGPGLPPGGSVAGGYLGLTDSTGYFTWSYAVSPYLEAHSYRFWVGYWGGSATGPRPDTDIVGTIALFAQDANGNPEAPAGLIDLPNR